MFKLLIVGDQRFDYLNVVEHLDATTILVHNVQKATFPVSARDFVLVNHKYYAENELNLVICSVKDIAAPADGANGCVRAHIMLAGWRLRKLKDGDVEATYLLHVDPKGYIPSCIINFNN